jgi:hypothetical protein
MYGRIIIRPNKAGDMRHRPGEDGEQLIINNYLWLQFMKPGREEKD